MILYYELTDCWLQSSGLEHSAAQVAGHLSKMLFGSDCGQAGLVSGTLLPPLVGQRYCNAASACRVSFSAEAGGLHQGCQTAAFRHVLQLISGKRKAGKLIVVRVTL